MIAFSFTVVKTKSMYIFTINRQGSVNAKFSFVYAKAAGLLIIIFMFLASCGKAKIKEEVPPLHYKFDGMMKVKLYLPEGRFFIYRDSATANADSVVVTKSLITPDILHAGEYDCSWWGPDLCDGHGSPSYYSDYYSLVLTNYTNPSEWLNVEGSCAPNDLIKLANPVSHELFLWYPYWNLSSTTATTLNIPAMTVQGQSYTTVRRFETHSDSTSLHDHIISIIYWVPDIGVIKRTVIEGGGIKTQELVRRG